MLGKIQLNRLNLMQGPLPEIERHFLFIGRGSTNAGKVLSVGSQTDFDAVLGAGESTLKTQLLHARQNAGQNWQASVLPIAGDVNPLDAVDAAMELTSAEAIVWTEEVDASATVEAWHAKARAIMGRYMRPVFILLAAPGCADSQSWSDHRSAILPITANVAANQVAVVPQLWPFCLGAVAGRLCNRSVTVADSPMRVDTGPMVGAFSDRPQDKDGVLLSMAHLTALDKGRMSVPQWYPDYPGTYWGDVIMLDVPGGDYQVVENLRVVQKAMRQIYPLMVARIGNRRLNSTPDSIAENKSYFQRPLRAMAKSATIAGKTFPGEIRPPKEDAIEIVWKDRQTVTVYLSIQPYDCPKSITTSLMLDLSQED